MGSQRVKGVQMLGQGRTDGRVGRGWVYPEPGKDHRLACRAEVHAADCLAAAAGQSFAGWCGGHGGLCDT